MCSRWSVDQAPAAPLRICSLTNRERGQHRRKLLLQHNLLVMHPPPASSNIDDSRRLHGTLLESSAHDPPATAGHDMPPAGSDGDSPRALLTVFSSGARCGGGRAQSSSHRGPPAPVPRILAPDACIDSSIMLLFCGVSGSPPAAPPPLLACCPEQFAKSTRSAVEQDPFPLRRCSRCPGPAAAARFACNRCWEQPEQQEQAEGAGSAKAACRYCLRRQRWSNEKPPPRPSSLRPRPIVR